MIIINGKVYSGNVCVINGHVVDGNSNDDYSNRTVDERKQESSDGVKKIVIQSGEALLIVRAESKQTDISAHLHGSFFGDSNPQLCVKRSGDVIFLETELGGMNGGNISIISGSSVVIGNACHTSGLILDVLIPERMFDEICVESKNNSINVMSSVNARSIKVGSKNGNVDISASFHQLSIDCKNGNIDVNSNAQSDIILDLASKNGNVSVSLENIGISNVFVSSKTGSCRNNPRLRGRYTASGSIISKNGNMRFQ